MWKLHRDPRVWENPEEFLPKRFLTSHANVDASGQHSEFIPFGSGRRSCLGSKFAFQVSHLTLARLLQGFEFQTPLNMPVDMIEGLSINLPKATPLEVLLTPCLSSKLYQIWTNIQTMLAQSICSVHLILKLVCLYIFRFFLFTINKVGLLHEML